MAAGDLGEYVLVVGDFHIPDRANAIPEQFKELLKPGRMQHVLCTGNLTAPAQMEAVMELAPNVHTVRGDCDEDETLPEETVVVIGSFRIGLCHGHQVSPAGSTQALAHLQRRMDVDVLVTGHTHQHSIVEYELASPHRRDVVPSFLLFAVKDKTINVYIYQVVDGKRTVTQAEFTKPDA